MGNFYTLITGLPDLSLTDTGHRISLDELKVLLSDENEASQSDRCIFESFFLSFDCKNLVVLLKDETASIGQAGNYSRHELLDLIRWAKTGVSDYPEFMVDFVIEYEKRKSQEDFYADDALLLHYYEYLLHSKSKLVRRWAEMNINIANILTAFIAQRYGWNTADFVRGENYITDNIIRNQEKDFGLGKIVDYMPQLMLIAENTDPVEKEHQIDALKWLWLENEIFHDQFSTEAVFAYLCKAQILERWSLLNPEKGQAIFRNIIENLRGEAKVPDEFTKWSAAKS